MTTEPSFESELLFNNKKKAKSKQQGEKEARIPARSVFPKSMGKKTGLQKFNLPDVQGWVPYIAFSRKKEEVEKKEIQYVEAPKDWKEPKFNLKITHMADCSPLLHS
ncbi:unnamed protein product [Heterobilharzia americana]|nr:unnamed protein product [Heterobilharzia americana]